MGMTIWIVAAVVAGVWLLTWAVQLAAYAMFAIAWLGWAALRLAAGFALLAGFAAAALFGPAPVRRYARATLAGGALTRPA